VTPRHTKVVTAAALLIVFSLAAVVLTSGQVRAGRGRRGHRVGSVVLPTPPFNPNAGILDGPKTRRGTSNKVTPRRTVNSGAKAGGRNPRPGTPRKSRVRRAGRGGEVYAPPAIGGGACCLRSRGLESDRV
jgi:hypothetical protein